MYCRNGHKLNYTCLETYKADYITCHVCQVIIKDRDGRGQGRQYDLAFRKVIECVTPLPYNPSTQPVEFFMWFCPSLSKSEAKEISATLYMEEIFNPDVLKDVIRHKVGIMRDLLYAKFKKPKSDIVEVAPPKKDVRAIVPGISGDITWWTVEVSQTAVTPKSKMLLQKLSDLTSDNLADTIGCQDDIQDVRNMADQVLTQLGKK